VVTTIGASRVVKSKFSKNPTGHLTTWLYRCMLVQINKSSKVVNLIIIKEGGVFPPSLNIL
jgi:hypothetical protein